MDQVLLALIVGVCMFVVIVVAEAIFEVEE